MMSFKTLKNDSDKKMLFCNELKLYKKNIFKNIIRVV